MNEIEAWRARQVRRDRGVVRLEEALLGNRLGRYFTYRLRFFMARASVSTVIHAIKIVLLLGAFPRSEFVAVVVLQATFALTGDLWWGALEELRARVRSLQRRGARHRIAAEIARWLTLSTAITVTGLGLAAAYAGLRLFTGGLGAVDLFVIALIVGAALELTARTYHSGVYALRRVYRPLPSLLALDVVSIGVLLAAWPLIGIWAFPLAELLAVLTVVSISFHYTSRAYRTLALPTIGPLLRLRSRIPGLPALRAALAPGVAYALVGLEALVVIAGIATATSDGGPTLIAVLAALAPVNRAGFEWARLLYFDLKKMDIALVANLRRRFDRAARHLALVMGVATWAVAAVVVAIVGGFTVPLLLALLALFMARSLLAGEQMQVFTGAAYLRLAAVGFLGVLGVFGAFIVFERAEMRIAAVAAVLTASFLVLLVLPGGRDRADAVLSLPDWLRRLRQTSGPVHVTRLSFDGRLDLRGNTVEARRAEAWRRREVAQRMAARVNRRGGATAWAAPTQLWFFEPVREPPLPDPVAVGGGLLDRPAIGSSHASGPAAAQVMVGEAISPGRSTGFVSPPLDAVMADFARRFPTGLGYDIQMGPPPALTAMTSALRSEIYRAALVFARDLRRSRGPDGLEVTSLVLDGSLRAIFIVDRREDATLRRGWRHTVREITLRSAALGAPEPAVASLESARSPEEARML